MPGAIGRTSTLDPPSASWHSIPMTTVAAPPAPILRVPTPADVPALARLGRESFVAKFGYIYHPDDLATFLDQVHTPEAVAAELARDDRLYCIAEGDGRLLGYSKLGLAPGWPEHARGQRAMELKQLYAAPDATGRGIGRTLMDRALAEARARGADEIQLSVYSENPGAQRFYARYGFEKVADIQFHVGRHIDAEYLFSLLI